MAGELLSPEIVAAAITSGSGLASMVFKQLYSRYAASDQYLNNVLTQKGKITDKDLEVAAKIYAIPKLHREYTNIAKTLIKADNLYEKVVEKNDKTIELIQSPSDDWLDYYLDKIKTVSDAEIQNLWASILVAETLSSDSFRKVMLDRIALLDQKSAVTFQILCDLTYQLFVSDGRTFSIPLILRDNILRLMVDDGDISEEMAIEYQNYLKGYEYNQSLDSIDEIEYLEEIGLLSLSDGEDESDVYNINKVSYTVKINKEMFSFPTQRDQHQKTYYTRTGCGAFTRVGLALYNAVGKKNENVSFLSSVVRAYRKYQLKHTI